MYKIIKEIAMSSENPRKIYVVGKKAFIFIMDSQGR
jgi:hypothetical protein